MIDKRARQWPAGRGRLAAALAVALAGAAIAQAPSGDDIRYSLKFNQAPMEMVLADYSQKTGRTLLASPKLGAGTLTLRSQTPLSLDEYIQAVETMLAMHGVGLVKVGETFIKVVPIAEVRQESLPIDRLQHEAVLDEAGDPLTDERGQAVKRIVPRPETDEMVSQLIPLKHIDLATAKTAVDPLKHAFGTVHQFETINSLLVTDTAANINRINEVLELIDQPVTALEEPHIIGIQHSKASDIKRMLDEIVAASQQEEERRRAAGAPRQRPAGRPGTERQAVPTPPGVIRAVPAPSAVVAVPEEIIAEAERGIIRGSVKIFADDRTNILLIITRPENMAFFDRVVQVLDVETAPDVAVRVVRLEYALAKDVAGMINDLIGVATPRDAPAVASPVAEGESRALREFERAREAAAAAAPAEVMRSKVGELSKENVKILADERTNALVIMARRADMETLMEIIGDMDIMLSQVLVEAVVLEVNLDNTFESGFDWLQRSLIAYNERADGSRQPRVAFAGTAGGGTFRPDTSLRFTRPEAFPTGGDGSPLPGLTYYLSYFDLSLDMVLRLVSTDSRTRILSSPVILTTDNTEATIDVSTERYFYRGKKYVGGGDNPFYEDDVTTRKVGISLTLTPRINEKNFVVMQIAQEIANVSGVQVINNTEWPIVTTRKLNADVAVRSGQTIVLGGLVQTGSSRQQSRVPFLGDIPILGIPFRSHRDDQSRTEVIVFITPYVMDSPEAITADAVRRRTAVSIDGMWRKGWSDSDLAEPSREQIRAARQMAQQEERRRREEARRRDREPRADEGGAPGDAAAAPPAADAGLGDFIESENRRWGAQLDALDDAVRSDL